MAEFAKAFVTGFPVDRSLLPYIHHYWLQACNLRGSYEAVPTGGEAFPRFLADIGQKGFCGGNIAAPHKETALSLVAQAGAEAQGVGAVNMVWLEDGRLCGDDSNSRGFAANLDTYAGDWPCETALVLGSGAFARAVIYALLKRDVPHIVLADCRPEPITALAEFFRRQNKAKISVIGLADVHTVLPQAGLLVNVSGLALPLSMRPLQQNMAGDSPAEEEDSAAGQAFFDYMDFSRAPAGAIAAESAASVLQTPFLQAAGAAGLKTVDGLGMLLHQAVFGFERWFGRRPQVTAELRRTIAGQAANIGR